MALETGTFVDDLNSANPVGASDLVTQGDDHLRLIKAVLKNTFPGMSKAFYAPDSLPTKTADYSVPASAANSFIPCDMTAGSVTITLPAAASSSGFYLAICKTDSSSNALVIDGAGSDLVNGAATISITAQYAGVLLWCDGSEWFVSYQSNIIPQPVSERLTEISALVPADGNVLIGDGTNFILESGATFRASIGAGVMNNSVEDLTPQLGGALDTNGKPVDWSQGADVASAAELLVLRDGNSFNVTGAVAITSIETTADAWPIGSFIRMKFTGAPTLTHDAANLVLLGGADITVAAGDWVVFRKYAAGDWEMVSFHRGDAASLVGGTAGYVLTANGAGAAPSMQAVPNGLTAFAFMQNIAIISGALFTNSSGGHDPLFYKCYLTCLTAEHNYPVGAVLPVYPNQGGASPNRGFSLYVGTATGSKIYGVYGSDANAFEALDQSGGAMVALTNANWDLTIIAYE